MKSISAAVVTVVALANTVAALTHASEKRWMGSVSARAIHKNHARGVSVGTSGDIDLTILAKGSEDTSPDVITKRQLTIGGLTLGGPGGGISGNGINLKGNNNQENQTAPVAQEPENGNQEGTPATVETPLQGQDILEFLQSIAAEENGQAEEVAETPAAEEPAQSVAGEEQAAEGNKAVEESEQFSEGFGITLDEAGNTKNLGGNLGITTGSDGSKSIGGSNGINIAANGEATIEGNETD